MIEPATAEGLLPDEAAAAGAAAAGTDAGGTRWRGRRLLFVVNDLGYFFSHRLPIARAAARAGLEVHVAVPGGGAAGREVLAAEGFRGHELALPRGRGALRREIGALRDLFALLRRLEPDLVHCVTIKPAMYGGVLLRLTGRSGAVLAVNGLGYTFTSRSWKARLLRVPFSWLLRFALGYGRAAVVVQNPDDYGFLIRKGFVEPERLTLIKGSGADPDLFRPAAAPPPGPCLVVLGARMLWDKGVGEFVEAARALRGEGSDARFVLVGDTDPFNPAAISPDRLSAWQAEGVVEWWGQRTDMPTILRNAHIACLPSYREGLPKFLIEAAAVGLPIVTTDVPGCREIVRDGENGLLVPLRRVPELAAALGRLLAEPELRERYGRRGRERVLNEFSQERVVAQTMALYETLLPRAGSET